MSEKLLPCPFCGGEAIANSDEIECAKCCAQGPLGEFRRQEWNKREPLCSDTIATLTKQALSQQEQIEALRAVLEDAQRIIERDFPNGQLVIDIRSALNGGCACTSVDRSHCQEIDCQSNHVTPADRVEP